MRKTLAKIGRFVKKRISITFLVMLLISIILWFATKLGHTYTSSIPVDIIVGEMSFEVKCTVEASGYSLMTYKILKRKKIELEFQQLQATPSMFNSGYLTVNAHSLQNEISSKIRDAKIISIEDIPEIKID